MATRNWGTRLITGLAILLAISFFGSALFKLLAFSATAEQFERFGYEPWFVGVTIVVELFAATLLLFRSTRYWGATLIIITMVAAMLSHLKADEPQEMIAPLILFLVACVVAWSGPVSRADESSSASDAPARNDQPLWLSLAQQVGGMVLCVVGIYVGIICVFGNEPLLVEHRLLRWAGMALGFGAAFFGITLVNSTHKDAAA